MAYTVHYRNEAPVPNTIHGPTWQRASQEGFDCGFRAAYWHIAVACNVTAEMLYPPQSARDRETYETVCNQRSWALWALADLGDEDAIEMTNGLRKLLLKKELNVRTGGYPKLEPYIIRTKEEVQVESYARLDRLTDQELYDLCCIAL